MAKFFEAPQVEKIARPLIRAHHKHLLDHNIHVEFLFRDDEPKSGGKAVLGTARKISGHAAFLANCARLGEEAGRDELNQPFFLITMTWVRWQLMNSSQRAALTDHELMHCGIEYDEKDEVKLVLVPHTFEGFADEIERHGIWRHDAERMAEVIKPYLEPEQAPLFEVPARPARGTRREVEQNDFFPATVTA